MKKTRLAMLIAIVLALSVVDGLQIAEVQKAQANPIVNTYNDIPPPRGTQPPIVTLYTPKNGSSYPQNMTLSYSVTKPVTEDDGFLCRVARIYYTCNWQEGEVLIKQGSWGSGSIDLSDAPSGKLSITVYADGYGCKQTGEEYKDKGLIWEYNYFDRFELTGSSTVTFIKDTVAPQISILSPQNITYSSAEVMLDFTVNESSLIQYRLDKKEMRSINGNVTLTSLSEGTHNVVVYAEDSAGNVGKSDEIAFSIETQPTGNPSPSIPELPSWIILPVLVLGAVAGAIACSGKLPRVIRER